MLGTLVSATLVLQSISGSAAVQVGGGGAGFGILPKGGSEVVGYLPYYRMSTISPQQIALCSDVIYFSVLPTPSADLWYPPNFYNDLEYLRRLRSYLHFKLYLCVGAGTGGSDFAQAASTLAGRIKLSNTLALLAYLYDLDGIDFDWEFPANWTEVGNYIDLMERTRVNLSDTDKDVTVAVAPLQLLNAQFFQPVSRVHMMAYLTDLTTCQSYANIVLSRGCPPSKLAIGVPFYGKDQGTGATYRYSTLVANYPQIDADPDLDWVNNIFFNGRTTQINKTNWARSQGFRGIVAWELGQDIVGNKSLLYAIRSASGGG